MTSPKSKKIFQAVVVTALVLLLCGGGASAQTLRVGAEAVVKNTYEPGKGFIGLKLRNGPGLKAPQIGNLPEDTRVKIIGGPVSKDGHTWWNVESPMGKGWCSGNWLTPAPGVTVPPTTLPGPIPTTPPIQGPGGTMPPTTPPGRIPPPDTVQASTQRLQEISSEIQRLRKEMIDGQYKLPEYLPGTSGKVSAIIGGFGTKEYDKHWYEAKSYHDTAHQQLKQASDFARSGNAEGAMNSLNQAKQSLQKFLASISASATAWDSQLAKAERIAKAVQITADMALQSLASTVPGAPAVVQKFLLARNFAFDSYMQGFNEATKNAVITIAASKIFESAPLFSEKPIKGIGDIDLSMLAKRLREDQTFRGRVENEIIKSLGQQISEDMAVGIARKTTDEFARYLEAIAPQTPPIVQRPVTPVNPILPPGFVPIKPTPPSPPVAYPTPQPPSSTPLPGPTYNLQGKGGTTPPLNQPATTYELLKVGINAMVTNTYEPGKGYIGLNLRSAPGLNSSKVGNLPEGTRVKIIGGPHPWDGLTWWEVESPKGKGWCSGSWLAPAP